MTSSQRTAHLLEGLNPPQRAAVEYLDGPLLILAGAGSGKTRTITHKLAYLCIESGLHPSQILAVTFTNKAAAEMRERVVQLLGAHAALAQVATFHATGLRILRRFPELIGRAAGFVVYDQADQLTLVKQVLKELGLPEKRFVPKDLLAWIEEHKHFLRPFDASRSDPRPFDRTAREVAQRYQACLRANNAVDFGDLNSLVVQLFETHPEVLQEYRERWRYVLVDEFQDTNAAQYRLLHLLVGAGAVCVVGDDDQSIYRWRGANVENILQFERDYPGTHVVRLEQNYRSTKTILGAAGAVIEHNDHRHKKRLWTSRTQGEPITLFLGVNETDEARFVVDQVCTLRAAHPLDQMAVFYRTHSQSRPVEDALRARALPYRVYGGLRFYDRAEVKDVLAYLRIIHNPADAVSLLRMINLPPRGIGKTTIERLTATADSRQISLYEALPELAEQSGGAVARHLETFKTLLDTLRVEAAAPHTPHDLLLQVLERSEYLSWLNQQGTIEAETRLENLRELVNAVDEFSRANPHATLGDYLDQVSLVSNLDDREEPTAALTLMTVHSAKGLEFDVVFVIGMEEGLLPHANARRSEAESAEERRLCYVALTRARERLFLSCVSQRWRFGSIENNPPSRFLRDIPEELLRPTGPGLALRARRTEEGRFETPADTDDTLRYERADTPMTAGEAVGLRVRHSVFGEGVIEGAVEDRVQVRFRQVGRKTVLARYLLPVDPI